MYMLAAATWTNFAAGGECSCLPTQEQGYLPRLEAWQCTYLLTQSPQQGVFPIFILHSMTLIHNLSQVNAKLSDYGIACYATESGLTQPMGTAGCKAPELLAANTSYMSYNDKVSFVSCG